LLASLGSKGKNGNSLACLRNAGSHSAVTYCNDNWGFIVLEDSRVDVLVIAGKKLRF